jgi:hypothetical protein
MNIYTIYTILSVDEKKHKIYVLSSESDSIVFPIDQIQHVRLLQNELRYNIKHYFLNCESNGFLENISLSFLDIQNELVLELLQKENNYLSKNIDINKDIIILCGFVIPKPIESKLYWNEFIFDIKNENDISQSIIDYTIYRCA